MPQTSLSRPKMSRSVARGWDADDTAAADMARAFAVPVVINAGFRDGSLRQAARDHNVPVQVYEAGEALRFHEGSIRAGVNGVTRVMRHLGMLAPSSRAKAIEPLVLRINVQLGQFVENGQCLAFVADPVGENEGKIVAPVSGVVVGRPYLPLMHEGDALFNLARTEGAQVVATALDDFDPVEACEGGVTAGLAIEPQIV